MNRQMRFCAHRRSEAKYYRLSSKDIAEILGGSGLDLAVSGLDDGTTFDFSKNGIELFTVEEFWGLRGALGGVGSKLSLSDPERRELSEVIRECLSDESKADARAASILTFEAADPVVRQALQVLRPYVVTP